ncbi:hypothetical protein [Paenibacillus luteus]|uniref:hypothetical protein n=1 Tax=Paenibacillus luteus TaxID=2545753 RepID=UPI001142E032|nr:hypothetical protein [Paenibacillus luteus]
MNDKFDRKKWRSVRARGRTLYAIRWILYFLLFYAVLQSGLFFFSDKKIDLTGLAAILAISFVMGIAASIIKWIEYERKYKA